MARIELVNPVQNPQQRGLPAAGRADKRGHVAVVQRQADVFEGLELAIEETDLADLGLDRRDFRRGDIAGRRLLPYRRLDCKRPCGRRAHCLKLLHEARTLAAMLTTRMAAVINSAPPQARVCQSA